MIGSLVDVRPKKEAFAHPVNKYNIYHPTILYHKF